MKHIKLSQGFKTMVDEEDFDSLNQFKWSYANGYAIRTEYYPREKTIWLHREILNSPIDKLTDHINGDKLDNRRHNLRIVTALQNCWNRPKRSDKTSSKYKGVYRYVNKNNSITWQTQIRLKGKLRYIGYFKTEHQAALAYDLWAKDLFGEYARSNFPTEFRP